MNEARALLSTGIALAMIAFVATSLPWDTGTGNAPLSQHASVVPSLGPDAPRASSTTISTRIATGETHASPDIARAGLAASVRSEILPEAERVRTPYPFAPLSFEEVNIDTRAALVNIFCVPNGGSLKPISGSGVVIDPRGIILTNAHVAQYVLLSEDPRIDLTCSIRTGSPATPRYTPRVLVISPDWIAEHASEINTKRPLGTGQHDWALLKLSPLQTSPAPVPDTLPSLAPDTRSAIGFVDDRVLAAGYPAEFVGGIIAQTGLYPVSSVSTVAQLLTLATSTVDLISIGSVIEAQGGSSGGPVVNQWDRLIGIITTTSEGTTTADRDLRALTTDYIDRDMRQLMGFGLTNLKDMSMTHIEESFAPLKGTLLDAYVSLLTR